MATASWIFTALIKHDAGVRALLLAIPDVFPWVRHLSSEEVRGFTADLVEALSDAADAVRPTSGDFGPIEVHP